MFLEECGGSVVSEGCSTLIEPSRSFCFLKDSLTEVALKIGQFSLAVGMNYTVKGRNRSIFEPSRPVAQLAEQRSPKPQVGGSIPSWPAIIGQVAL